MKEKNLLVGISGSIATLSTPEYLNVLREEFPNMKLIMTRSASQFIPQSSLSMFAKGTYSSEFPLQEGKPNHVELARWADLFIVLPSTAHLLAQVAHGMADTLLSATILSFDDQVIFFPNMNKSMWIKPSTQRNVSLVEEDGHRVVQPLEREAFEYASKEKRPNLLLPSSESVLSILKLKCEVEV